MKFISLFILLCFISIACLAQKPKLIRAVNLQTENDFLTGLLKLRNEDKDYSGGFKFEFYTDYLKEGIFPLFRNRARTEEPNDILNYNSIYIQGAGFTPNREAFRLSVPDSNQRPYASFIGIGRRRIAVFPTDKKIFFKALLLSTSITSDFFVGRIGIKGPGNFQNFLHEYVTNSEKVMGWNTQIANGGKWLFNYNVRTTFKFDFPNDKIKKLMGLALSPHVSFGNMFVGGGAKLAITNQSVSGIALTSPINSNSLSTDESREGGFQYEIYHRPQYVAHNTLLMGMPFYNNSQYTIDKNRIRRWVSDSGIKITYTYNPDRRNLRSTTVFLEGIYRSPEYKSIGNFNAGPSHIFGVIGVTIYKLGV